MKTLLIVLVSLAGLTASAELTGAKILQLCRVDGVEEACDYKDIQNELTEAEKKCGWIDRATNGADCQEVDQLKLKRAEALKKLKEVLGEE